MEGEGGDGPPPFLVTAHTYLFAVTPTHSSSDTFCGISLIHCEVGVDALLVAWLCGTILGQIIHLVQQPPDLPQEGLGCKGLRCVAPPFQSEAGRRPPLPAVTRVAQGKAVSTDRLALASA